MRVRKSERERVREKNDNSKKATKCVDADARYWKKEESKQRRISARRLPYYKVELITYTGTPNQLDQTYTYIEKDEIVFFLFCSLQHHA